MYVATKYKYILNWLKINSKKLNVSIVASVSKGFFNSDPDAYPIFKYKANSVVSASSRSSKVTIKSLILCMHKKGGFSCIGNSILSDTLVSKLAEILEYWFMPLLSCKHKIQRINLSFFMHAQNTKD